ncbi:MAG: hypothetical protein K1X83_03230 [Oligoflexia bacterium]|nr:hypothetical protein [Oligoflexia bacterium]
MSSHSQHIRSRSAAASRSSKWRDTPIFWWLLAGLFAAAFVIPFLFAAKIPQLLASKASEIASEEGADSLFPDSVFIGGADALITVRESAVLNPPVDKDFLLVAWFKLRNLPANGDDVRLLSHIDDSQKQRPGYAIALARHKNEMRPIVYWNAVNQRAKWKIFDSVKLNPKSWFMIALSFYRQRYLGVHIIELSSDGKGEQRLLGGYDVGEAGLPGGSASLLLGSHGTKSFRGKVGPFGIFNIRDLGADLNEIIKEFRTQPLKLPSRFADANVMLWSVDGRTDQSKNSLKITAPSEKKRPKK